MVSFFSVTPSVILFGVTVGMMILIFQFDRLRWMAAKDYLSRFWSVDRRRVLLLNKLNGFYFFADKLIEWSGLLLRFSWLAIVFALSEGLESVVFSGLMVTMSFLVRFSYLMFYASQKVRRFTMPLEYDGYGVYARAAADWRGFRNELRQPLVVSSVWTLVLVCITFTLC